MTKHSRIAVFLFVAACLANASRAGQWTDERAAGPFVFHADFPLDDHVELLSEIAGLHHELSALLGIAKPRRALHAYLLHDKQTYRNYVKHFFPNVPFRRAMFVKRQGQCMVFAYLSDKLDVDLRHECTHALLHASLPVVPLWLDEGLAEYFELPQSQRAHDNPYLGQVKFRNWFGAAAKIDKLEQIRQLAEMDSSDYRDAWAWVHFMLHGSEAAYVELIGFLRDIAAQSPPGRLSERLRQRIPELDQRFIHHFRNWQR